MDALDMTLLFDYYGDLLTQRQRMCFDLRYNQDMSLGEIAQELEVSRQGVNDNLKRAEAQLLHMEQKTGLVSRDLQWRKAARKIHTLSEQLLQSPDPQVSDLAGQILSCVRNVEE